MEAKRVVKEMNKPQLLPIVGLAPVVAILTLGVAIALGALYSWLAGIAVFFAVISVGRWIERTDPKFIELFFLSLSTGSDYDPALMEDLHEYPKAD
jgi:type IV secretory pathway TrbD component